ncbi:MAG: hypothetical protein C4575_11030 [Desulforudis sp.]|jgi:hypothetical protein|nr:MAG: hypothetical protein C4575_11030 [Desulforudis sp.]
MLYLAAILFGLEVFLFLLADRKIYNSIYTPVGFLGVPFVAVVTLSVLVGNRIGFVQPDVLTILIFIYGAALFWLPGMLLSMGTVSAELKVSPFTFIRFDQVVNRTIRLLSWLFLLIVTLGFARTYLVYGRIGSEAFSAAFAGGGLVGHCLSMMKYNAAYLFASERRVSFGTLFLFLTTLLFLMMYNVKGWVIMTLLVALVARHLLYQSRVNVVKVVAILALGTGIFAVSYVISLGNVDPVFLFEHFFHYLFAGVAGLSEHLRAGVETDHDFLMLFQPIRNIVYFLLGKEVVGSFSEFWVNIHLFGTRTSNVKTFFGDIIVFGGIAKGSVVVIWAGLASYALLLFSLVKRSGIALVLYLFFAVSLALGWFAYYFNSLFYYEVVCYVFLLLLGTSLYKFLVQKGYWRQLLTTDRESK